MIDEKSLKIEQRKQAFNQNGGVVCLQKYQSRELK